MASATADPAATAATPTPTDGGLIRLDSIPIVDLRLLSQSELYSLSRCSSSASDSNRRDDVVVPIIDRSVFNESAGSRKQTYSRLRLAPSDSSSSTSPRGRTPHLRSTSAAYGAINSKTDPENSEDYQIIHLLKQLFVADIDPGNLFPVKIEYSNSLPARQFALPPLPFPSNLGSTGLKRKRGRPRRNEYLGNVEELAVEVNVVDACNMDMLPIPSPNEIVVRDIASERDREVLNSDGVAVDLAAVGAVEHPYREEIRRRTEGLQTEEELLGFLTGLNGKWGSRRKKKRIVDAGEFGSKLPVGWKLLLSIKKKDGHVWLYCRRYISPSGLHFVSCKGVSSYLLSLHGVYNTNPHSSAQYNDIVNDADKLISVPLSVQYGHETENLVSCAPSPPLDLATGNYHEIQVVVNTGNLLEDRIGESICHPSSSNEFSVRGIAMEGSSKYHSPMEVCNLTGGPNSCSVLNNNDEHFVDLEEGSGNMRGTVSATDIVTETNPCSAAEVLFSSNENKSFLEDACPNDSGAVVSDHSSTLQGRRLESSLSCNDAAYCDMNVSLIENSAALDHKQTMVSKSSLFDCNDHVEECLLVNNNQHTNDGSSNQTRNELKFDSQKLGVDGSVFDIFGTRENQENLAAGIAENSNLEYATCKDIGTTESISPSGSGASKLEKDLTISLRPIADDEKACQEDNVHYSSIKCKVNETLSFAKFDNGSSKTDNDDVNRQEEMQFEIVSVTQSWNGEENASKKGDEVFTHPFKSPGVQDMSKSIVVANNDESMHCYENNDGEVCRSETKESEFENLQSFGIYQSTDLFSSGCARLSSKSMTRTEQDTRLGVCSPFTSKIDKQLSVEDNMITIFNDTMEERRQDTSEILVDQSGVSGVSDEAYNLNEVYITPTNPSELKRIENAGKHELSLFFDSHHTDMSADNSRVDQESYQANSFNIDSVVHKTYGDPTHSSIPSIAANLEQDRPFRYPNLSFNDRTHEPDCSFNVAHPERDWNGMGRNMIRDSSQNFMIGFRNSSLQTSESVAANDPWRIGQDNAYGGCFDANSNPHIPLSSSFPTFGLAPTKDQESSFGVDSNYDLQKDMMLPGRTQPVEYSFMGDQRVNSLPGELKAFPFGTNMEQGMGSSFWLGKDAATANASPASQETSICFWCRNILFHEPIQTGMQTGAIGSICPSCSSKIPGQFNLL